MYGISNYSLNYENVRVIAIEWYTISGMINCICGRAVRWWRSFGLKRRVDWLVEASVSSRLNFLPIPPPPPLPAALYLLSLCSSSLKKGTACFSEKLASTNQSTEQLNLKEHFLHRHGRENFKSHTVVYCWLSVCRSAYSASSNFHICERFQKWCFHLWHMSNLKLFHLLFYFYKCGIFRTHACTELSLVIRDVSIASCTVP
jgi:hypothetical protein